ncbi:peptidoglycan/xylan/chitin deacetylase (PgdA/CDA1 family) [Stackebrandtia endophytica]|uniref:Peptidoglycan/xylan/chitin deacetylase (PgdA/CDA1 family) n=1 Tax=Stackebrandtia endophytica TaxID=1496996 RepID=A0A543AUL7_9ACTN|nr:polysaccharide deacetylase family protein [Stackebrandtia endophytica]TQL76270.1 peptidoglycan/xylan/chitin deacetylase (PgdA/CDA1 family) [Stackebrandtia endophytica]
MLRFRPALAGLVAAGLLAVTGCGTTPPDSAAATPTPSEQPAPSPSEAPELPGTSDTAAPPPVVFSGEGGQPRIALTFDADMTQFMWNQLDSGEVASQANVAIFDYLETENIPATFFIGGMWAERYPEHMTRLADNPDFQLANHSYEHMGFTSDCYELGEIEVDAMAADVAKTFDLLEPYGGNQSRYFRFPGGCYDDVALEALQPLGLTVVQWDVVSGDPFATAAQPLVDAVLSTAQPGSIVVMHCNEGNAQYTDEALPDIVAGLREQGYEFVTLSELLGE